MGQGSAGQRRDPAAAFLAACGPGQPDAARAFGLLARHVPDWSADQDLYQALCRWGPPSPGRDGARPSRSQLAAAAERYFRRALQGALAESGGPQPADLERVTRRLITLYFPDVADVAARPEVAGPAGAMAVPTADQPGETRPRAAGELVRAVESWIVAAITEHGPNRRRRRPFGLPVLPLTFTLTAAASAGPSGAR
ncbi:hypothetical protein [Candidatus Frankia nodulisporulans]|uniref:hypothetical protein n=1 Tax=Candidatus Frankia nodulisporulans TaxID=2060052 RepID=UPI0013D1EA80